MPENDILGELGLLPELGAFTSLLEQQGVAAALAYLNRRTPHRYTGLFRFAGDVLHPQVLVDGHQPTQQPGPAPPLAVAYCALVGRQPASLAGPEVLAGPPTAGVVPAPLFYQSVLIRDAQGRAHGTLCHYDEQRCQPRTTDLPLLEAAATLLYAHCGPPA